MAVRRPARANDFGHGGQGEILSATGLVPFPDDVRLAGIERSLRIDPRTIFAVREQTVAVRIDARRDRGAVDVGRRRIDRVMAAEGHAFAREFPKRGSIALGDEIGPHPVPDNDDDVAIVW